MRRTLTIIALTLALTVPANARPIRAQRQHKPSWTLVWRGLIYAIGNPFRLFDDSGGHTIPILTPTPTSGS